MRLLSDYLYDYIGAKDRSFKRCIEKWNTHFGPIYFCRKYYGFRCIKNAVLCRDISSYIIHSFIHSSVAVRPFVGPGLFFNFLIFFTQTVGLLGRVVSPSQGRYLHTKATQTQNKRTQTTMPRVGFEPTIPSPERTKTVYASDSTITVIGQLISYEF
jgi:hypothetical protein